MPSRFYFHLVKGQQRIADQIGADVPRDIVMSPAVLDVAREIWPGIDDPVAWTGWSIEVYDGGGTLVRIVALE